MTQSYWMMVLHSWQWHETFMECIVGYDSKPAIPGQTTKTRNYWNCCIVYDWIRSQTDRTFLNMDHHLLHWTSSCPTHTQHPMESYPLLIQERLQQPQHALSYPSAKWHLYCGLPKRRTTMHDSPVRNDYKLSSHWSTSMSIDHLHDLNDQKVNKLSCLFWTGSKLLRMVRNGGKLTLHFLTNQEESTWDLICFSFPIND